MTQSNDKIKGPVRKEGPLSITDTDNNIIIGTSTQAIRNEVFDKLDGYDVAVGTLENIRKAGDDWAAQYAKNTLKALGELDDDRTQKATNGQS